MSVLSLESKGLLIFERKEYPIYFSVYEYSMSFSCLDKCHKQLLSGYFEHGIDLSSDSSVHVM